MDVPRICCRCDRPVLYRGLGAVPGLDMFNRKESPAIISEMEQASGKSWLYFDRGGLKRVREKFFGASNNARGGHCILAAWHLQC
jgi:hypothetical protein